VSEAAPTAAAPERFALRGGREVALHASGFVHPSGSAQRFTPYVELIHVALGPRGLRLGTARGSVLLPRSGFAVPGAAGELAQRLRGRVYALPDGEARRARQAALDRRQAAAPRPRVGLVLALACILLHALASLVPAIQYDGEYWRVLGFAREPWRLVTSQLLHAGVPHLVMNALGLWALGSLLERQLGALRTALVSAAAAAGAMVGCGLAGYAQVVGASGLVMGYAGALVALELRRPDLLPALLRLPRGLLVGAIVAEFAVLSFVPNVAHAAHAGGLVAGALAALVTAPDHVDGFAPGPVLKGAFAGALALALAALAALGVGLLDPGGAAARRGARLLDEKATPVLLLNNDAWTIATSDEPSEDQLELALALARRAVKATGRQEPNFLDTLAEVYFQLGRSDDAVRIIDQAIALAPGVDYFVEQRRRFLGERDADDRPEPPSELPALDPDEPEIELPQTPGIRV
jgi:membrane associated rhomboid family serine protease